MVPINWMDFYFVLFFSFLSFFFSRELLSSREKNFENLEFAPPCPPLFGREEREGREKR